MGSYKTDEYGERHLQTALRSTGDPLLLALWKQSPCQFIAGQKALFSDNLLVSVRMDTLRLCQLSYSQKVLSLRRKGREEH